MPTQKIVVDPFQNAMWFIQVDPNGFEVFPNGSLGNKICEPDDAKRIIFVAPNGDEDI